MNRLSSADSICFQRPSSLEYRHGRPFGVNEVRCAAEVCDERPAQLHVVSDGEDAAEARVRIVVVAVLIVIVLGDPVRVGIARHLVVVLPLFGDAHALALRRHGIWRKASRARRCSLTESFASADQP